MNKKKMLAIALAVCLIAILSFTTLAWFTDSEEVKNTFTVGSIKIKQHEEQIGEDGTPEPFENDKVLIPIVDENDPSADPNYQDKIVTVENVGNNPAYVRTHIAVPKSLVGYLNLDVSDGNGWTFDYSTEVSVEGQAYVVYSYRYDAILEVGATTPAVLEGVYLYAEVDMKTNPESGDLEFCKWNDQTQKYDFSGFAVKSADGTVHTVDVLVATQAVQSQGFGSAQEALDAAFGNTTPWG